MALSDKILRDIELADGVRREAERREDADKRPLAQHLASELFGYAYNRLHGKMRTGEIVPLVQQVRSRVPLVLSARDLDDLHRTGTTVTSWRYARSARRGTGSTAGSS